MRLCFDFVCCASDIGMSETIRLGYFEVCRKQLNVVLNFCYGSGKLFFLKLFTTEVENSVIVVVFCSAMVEYFQFFCTDSAFHIINILVPVSHSMNLRDP